MKIKRIRAADMQSARDRVRELGPNAMIISIRSLDRGGGEEHAAGVEIIAGVDERPAATEQERQRDSSPVDVTVPALAAAAAYGRAAAAVSSQPVMQTAAPAIATGVAGAAGGSFAALLERKLEFEPVVPAPLVVRADSGIPHGPAEPTEAPPPEQTQAGADEPERVAAEQAYDLLRALGLNDDIAEAALERAIGELPLAALDDVEALLEAALTDLALRLPAGPGLTPRDLSRRALFFVGPAGAGKTTSLLKAAVRLQKDGASVAVIGADASRLGSREQLEAYCRLLSLPFRPVYTAADLTDALHEFDDGAAVLVDTPALAPARRRGSARSQAGQERETAAPPGLVALIDAAPDHIVTLVVPVTLADRELRRLTSAARGLRASAVVLTRLDETGQGDGELPGAGAALNAIAHLRLPPLLCGAGRDVLTDGLLATADELVIAALEAASLRGASPVLATS